MNRFFSTYTINTNVVAFMILSFVSLIIFYNDSGSNYNFRAITQFFIVALLSLYGIFLSIDKWSFSLNKTYHIFTYFFIALAPVIQLKNEVSFFRAGIIKDEIYIKLGFILVLVQIVYLIIYGLLISILKRKKFLTTVNDENNNIIKAFFLISSLAFILFLILVKFDINVIFKRPPNHWQKENTNFGLIGYTLLLIIRAVPIIVLILYKYIYNRSNYYLFILVLLTAFPLSLNRGDLVTYYLPILLIFVPLMKKKMVYPISFFLGVLFLFPFFNLFRSDRNAIYIGGELFQSAHLDAFYNFANLLNLGVITYGRQLLGSLLFFIQESSWQNRPVGTGQMMAELSHYSYTNVSMPFLGEGYANFGIVGVFIFLIALVVFNAYSDVLFHERKSSIRFKIFYLFFLGFEFYLLRGDLYSSVKKVLSFLIALLMVKFALFFLNKLRFKLLL
ncbi:hypothetical protein [Aquimarina agarilytica]|uniref:hypothetical protein n=1 Tax=Aquimarina agarilytica TaxID=1087449 RepID=UPI000288AE4B|nr:hypothetical protein [Aquimarina agarilytica]